MLKGKGLPVSKGSRFRLRFRALGAGGLAALGASVMLAACSPVQMGAAAIVGNQSIGQGTLAADVTSLADAAAKYKPGTIPLPSSQFSQAVLGWLITFQVEDRTMDKAGVTLTDKEIQSGIAEVKQYAAYEAEQGQLPDATAYFVTSGIAPSMIHDLGRYAAQENAFMNKANGGRPVTNQAVSESLLVKLDKASCRVTKEVDIRVNPQYGKLEYLSSQNKVQVVNGPDLLSKPVTPTQQLPTGPGVTDTPAC